jgi:hypothetical protein
MAARVPNTALRNAIHDAGWTYAAAAAAVRQVAGEAGVVLRTNKSAVEHWVAGALPEQATRGYLAEALTRRLHRIVTHADLAFPPPGTGGDECIGLSLDADPVPVLARMWRAELDRRGFMATSAYSVAAALLPLEQVIDIAARTSRVRSGAVAGRAEVAAVRDMVSAFTEMDERHGGQHGRTALLQYMLDDVAPLCRGRFRTEADRIQMLSAASRGVHLIGWKAYDNGQQGLAQRYYLQSYALAAEAGLRGQDGFVLRTMAMQNMKLRRPEHCVALAVAGWDRARGHVDTQTEALFRIVHAHTLAKTGQRRQAVAEVEHARHALASDRGDEIPFWALAWGPPAAAVHARAAKVFETLGDRPGAADQYARAAASRPVPTFARVVALELAAQADMQHGQGHIEQACNTWSQAIDTMQGVHSARTRKAVTGLRRSIQRYRIRGLQCAQELDERALAFLRDS